MHLLPSTTCNAASNGFDQAWSDLALGARIRIVRNTLVDLQVFTRTALLADGERIPPVSRIPLHLMRQENAC